METFPGGPDRRALLALAALLAGYLALVWAREPVERFGRFHDDTLYAGTAQAIAQGRGHILPNLPGDPPSTKYPPVYPYALAAAMLLYPPAQTDPAVLWTLSAAAGALALVVAFVALSHWKNVGWTWAAAAVTLSVLQPTFLLASGAVLSDIPFVALALTAFWLADREKPALRYVLAAAAVAGLAVLTRSVGIAVAAGIAACFLVRRDLRSAAAFCAGVAPFGLAGFASKLTPTALAAGSPQGFRQTWLYYTDYAGFWRASVPDLETLIAMLYVNFGSLLWAPAQLCVGQPPPGQMGKIAWAVVTAAIVSGILRQAREDRWRPIHFALLFTLPAVLLWNYEIGERLLLAFAPLFALGVWVEGRHIARNVRRALRAGNPFGERAVAAVFLALMAGFAVFAGQRTVRNQIAAVSTAPERYDDEYRALYAWMRAHTRPDERFVAIDDGLFYLRTGRQGIWPLALTTEPRFRPDKTRLEQQMIHLPETASAIGARYAIHTDHDYAYAPLVQERWNQWTAGLPVLVENEAGTARVLDLGNRLASE